MAEEVVIDFAVHFLQLLVEDVVIASYVVELFEQLVEEGEILSAALVSL